MLAAIKIYDVSLALTYKEAILYWADYIAKERRTMYPFDESTRYNFGPNSLVNLDVDNGSLVVAQVINERPLVVDALLDSHLPTVGLYAGALSTLHGRPASIETSRGAFGINVKDRTLGDLSRKQRTALLGQVEQFFNTRDLESRWRPLTHNDWPKIGAAMLRFLAQYDGQ